MSKKELISIGKTAEFLGVSIDTLRRWDKSGKLQSVKSVGGHRMYSKSQLEVYLLDLVKLAKTWAMNGTNLMPRFYCANSAVFQEKLTKMQDELSKVKLLENIFPLIVAIAGEIGSNSFDHNLGNWPDDPGIFFAYDLYKKIIVLADRGQGILATLKRVRPILNSHQDALRVAFTEIISGRAPESRGNGLKFVRKVVIENPIVLLFKTGDAELELSKDGDDLVIYQSPETLRGCFAVIKF